MTAQGQTLAEAKRSQAIKTDRPTSAKVKQLISKGRDKPERYPKNKMSPKCQTAHTRPHPTPAARGPRHAARAGVSTPRQPISSPSAARNCRGARASAETTPDANIETPVKPAIPI